MAKKKKTLPKDFQELIDKNDIKALKNVFETCEIDARGGYGKTTALSFYNVSDDFVRWMVEHGADLEALDSYKRTALHEQASRRNGKIAVFLELGANIHAVDTYGSTPLHFAAGHGFNEDATKRLLEAGANTNILDSYKQTPLKSALRRAENSDIPYLVSIAKILLPKVKEVTLSMKDDVTRIGESFEFYRDNFNKDYIEEYDTALYELYALFDVTPVKRRVVHDGVSLIVVKEGSWEQQYEELWDFLVPSKGCAKTVQGELIRIAGKVRDEIHRNGGGNWDAHFKKMLDAYVEYLSLGNTLSKKEREDISYMIKDIRKVGSGESRELNYLCEVANKWVLKNLEPIPLGEVKYKR